MTTVGNIAAGLVLWFGLVGSPAVSAQEDGGDAAMLPSGPERELVLAACTTCHGLEPIHQAAGRTAAMWRMSVIDMIGRGAQIFPDEVNPIVNYLAQHFGPSGGAVDSRH